jgi:hypothetical protein
MMLSAIGPKQGVTVGTNKMANGTPSQSAQSKSLQKHPPHVVFELSKMDQPFSHLTNISSEFQRINIKPVNLGKDDPEASNSQEFGSAPGSRRDSGNHLNIDKSSKNGIIMIVDT